MHICVSLHNLSSFKKKHFTAFCVIKYGLKPDNQKQVRMASHFTIYYAK